MVLDGGEGGDEVAGVVLRVALGAGADDHADGVWSFALAGLLDNGGEVAHGVYEEAGGEWGGVAGPLLGGSPRRGTRGVNGGAVGVDGGGFEGGAF